MHHDEAKEHLLRPPHQHLKEQARLVNNLAELKDL